MNRSWKNNSNNSSPGLSNKNDTADFLSFNESPPIHTSPHSNANQRFSPTNYSSPKSKFQRSPNKFNLRSTFRYSGGNLGNRSFNSPTSNSGNRSFNSPTGMAGYKLFNSPTGKGGARSFNNSSGNRSFNSPGGRTGNSYSNSGGNSFDSNLGSFRGKHRRKGRGFNQMAVTIDGRDMSVFLDHTSLLNPWEELEKCLDDANKLNQVEETSVVITDIKKDSSTSGETSSEDKSGSSTEDEAT